MEVFGIDLGTTNSCVAVIGEDGQPAIIKNLDDEYTTPSIIFFDDFGSPYVGKEAKASRKSDPDRSVSFIKREMSNPKYQVMIDNQNYTPIALSAIILKKVVDDANEQRSYDGLSPIKKAVITVPAYFGNDEREFTRQAGEIAGIEVLGLLNEPTAAALSYGAKDLEGKTFMVYDLGGGTFDVSIMRMQNGNLETISTDGDHKLGGVDWDKAIIDYALIKAGIEETYDDMMSSPDLQKRKDAIRMLEPAENCKKLLSKTDAVKMQFIYKRSPYVVEIKRSEFEELTEELLESTIQIVDKAISIAPPDYNLTKSSINEIILVGGSSYMPMVKKRLQKDFSCNIRLDRFEPDRAIAKGAAIHAANLAGQKAGPKLEDKGSRSYGFEVITNEGDLKVENVVKRTDPLIYSGTSNFSTSAETDSVNLSLYENVGTDNTLLEISQCKKIDQKTLSLGMKVPKGTPVVAHVSRTQDGTVTIWVECNGRRVDFKVEPKGMLNKNEADSFKKLLEGMNV